MKNRTRASIGVAAPKKQLGVAPPETWGLVWCPPARRERERTRDSASLGEMVVVEQDLDLE